MRSLCFFIKWHKGNIQNQVEKSDHRSRNINAWVTSYREKSKGINKQNKISSKKLFAKDENVEPFKTKLSTSFSNLNSDGSIDSKSDCKHNSEVSLIHNVSLEISQESNK